MKIAILGDCHFGVRGNSERFHSLFEEFFSKQFFPYLDQHKITTVYQLGDLFDVRKNISPFTLSQCKRYFFNELRSRSIDFYTLLGNHDLFYRESLTVNTPEEVLGEYDNITIVNKPVTITTDDNTTFDFIPWICKENSEECFEFINKSKSDICLGHFEVAGFAMYRGMEAKHGIDPSIFDKYELTLSGHYHTKSRKENIIYTGTPFEMTWQDYNDPRGFHVFDTETRKLEFIQNNFTIYVKYEYNDSTSDPDKFDTSVFANKIVKIIVASKQDFAKFDKFMARVNNSEPYDVKIIEDLSEFREGYVEEEIQLEDTIDIVNKYIDNVETDLDKEKVKNYMKTLFLEALNAGNV